MDANMTTVTNGKAEDADTEAGTVPALRSDDWSRELVKEIAMDIGKEAAAHLEIQYPQAVAAAPTTMLLSLRNHIFNQIMAALERTDEQAIRAWLDRRHRHRRQMRKAWRNIRRSPSVPSPQ